MNAQMKIDREKVLASIQGGLIVSCQAEDHEPLGKPEILAAMAKAAVMGGAAGIRACYPQNISAIKTAVDVPVIGIYKKVYPDSEVFISATLWENREVAATKSEIIALDATARLRPNGEKLAEIIAVLRRESDALLMADISTLNEGIRAAEMGFDLVGTTLAGYTAYSRAGLNEYAPDFNLITKLARELNSRVPLIAEGRIWNPSDARKALDLGAYAVVVGSAITRPWLITERFVKALKD